MQDKKFPVDVFLTRLSDALSSKGWRSAELSRRTGLARGTVSRYLSGDRRPGADDLYRMAKELGISMEWLLGYDDCLQTETKQPTPSTEDKKADIWQLSCPAEIDDDLDKIAQKNYMKKSDIVRIAIMRFVDSMAAQNYDIIPTYGARTNCATENSDQYDEGNRDCAAGC